MEWFEETSFRDETEEERYNKVLEGLREVELELIALVYVAQRRVVRCKDRNEGAFLELELDHANRNRKDCRLLIESIVQEMMDRKESEDESQGS